jgi:hypothetical protein
MDNPILLPGRHEMARCRLRASENPSGSRCLLGSNSTRTESYVAIHHGQSVSSRVGAPKAPHQNGWQQITRPNREPEEGLKILVSALQSRPSPPLFLPLSRRGLRDQVVTRLFLGYSAARRATGAGEKGISADARGSRRGESLPGAELEHHALLGRARGELGQLGHGLFQVLLGHNRISRIDQYASEHDAGDIPAGSSQARSQPQLDRILTSDDELWGLFDGQIGAFRASQDSCLRV